MTTTPRFTARVIYAPDAPKTKHFRGAPPRIAGGVDARQLLAVPALLLIEQKPDGVFLFRFTADNRCVGDTWHESIDAAKQQATFEFDELLSAWKAVPVDVTDPVAFGLAPDSG